MIVHRSSLNPAVRRKIKDKERWLEKKCRLLWEFTNHLNETFLFGRFTGGGEETIVTIAVKCDVCIGGWNPFETGNTE